MFTTSFAVTCTCLIVMMQLLVQFGRMTSKQYNGWTAVLAAVCCAVSAMVGWTSNVYLTAGVAAWCAWLWWNDGGGDDTKRRLKRWAGRFQGVRRTAPQGA
jgi:general stress protein CsbA